MSDPIDYDSKQAAILSALRRAQELQQSEAPPVQYKQFGQIDHVIAPGPLSGVAAAINRGMGDIQEGQANRQQSELDSSQMREIQDYQKQLAGIPTETRRVLKKALGAPTGTLYQPQLQPGEFPTPQAPAQPEYEEVALTPEEQNAKRSEIAGGMYRLPKAREMAKELWKQTIDFPEKRAEQLEKIAAQKQLQAERLEEQSKNEALRLEDRKAAREAAAEARASSDALRMQIAQMGSTVAQQNADTNAARLAETKRVNDASIGAKEDKAAAKKAEMASKSQDSVAEADMILKNIEDAIGKRDENGDYIKDPKTGKPVKEAHPGFGSYVGFSMLPYSRLVHGSDAAGYESLHKAIGGSARLEGVKAMKGSGSVSNAEGAAAADAYNAAQASSDEKTYVRNMKVYESYVKRGRDRELAGLKITPDGREYRPGTADDPEYQGGAGGGAAPTVAAPVKFSNDSDMLNHYLNKGK